MGGIKTSHSMVELEEKIASLQSTLNMILEIKNNNLTAMTEQHFDILKQIKEIREKINNHLDKLEKRILDVLETQYKQNQSKIRKFIQNVEFHNSKLDKIKNDLIKIKTHATNKQTYFGMQKLDEAVKDEESEVEFFAKSKDILEILILFYPNPSCLDGNILESLGSIEVTEKQVGITLPKPKHKAAQILIPSVNVPSIDSIRVDKVAEVDLSGSVSNAEIRGCCFTDDTSLLTDSKNNQIIVLDQYGNFLRVFKLEFCPSKIVSFENNVAVSSYFAKAVQTINISVGQKLNEVTFDTVCDALAVAGDRLIVHLSNMNYTICDQSLNIVGTIPIRVTSTPYLGYYDNKIFVSRRKHNIVCCYTMEGDLVWKCQDENLQAPQGIAVTKYGYLLVAGYNSSYIFAISLDGTNRKELLNLEDVITRPTAISLNYNQSRLLITSNESSKILIYDLTNY